MATITPDTSGAPTGNIYVDALIWGGAWTDTLGTGATLNWMVRESANYSGGTIGDDITFPWANDEVAQLRAAFQAWANVANLTFVEVTSGGPDLDLEYVKVSSTGMDALDENPNLIGFHEVPMSEARPLVGVFDAQSTSWVSGLLPGGDGFNTLLHEIGHGLGLAHPHDGGADGQLFPGVDASNDLGDNALNQSIWTLMSYNRGWQGERVFIDAGHAATPMALDIAAIQAIYGANTTFASGDNTYAIPTATPAGTGWRCIWDTGGIDTIDASASVTSVLLDLRAAPLTGPQAGGYISWQFGVSGGFTIANGVVIENARGGTGADILRGNAAGNLLAGSPSGGSTSDGGDWINGYDGNDTITGSGGNDTLYGGNGDDSISSSNGLNRVFGGAGNDTIDGGLVGANTVSGGLGADSIMGSATGDDSLAGDGGNDAIMAEQGDDTVDGGDGNDTIEGGLDADELMGWIGDDSLIGDLDGGGSNPAFRDTIMGWSGNDTAFGGAADDRLFGHSGNDSLNGGNQNDLLDGGTGADTLNGGAGDDYAEGGDGRDVMAGEKGADTMTGGASGDRMDGGAGNDSMDGGADADRLDGGEDDDLLLGGAGIDTLLGGLGADTLGGGTENDYLVGGAGADSIAAGDGNDYVSAGTENDTIDAGRGADKVFAGDGNDSLFGGGEADLLSGSYGNDTIEGGAGADTLTGGTGADRFVFASLDDLLFGTPDVITDFTTRQGDVMDFRLIDANARLDGDQGFAFYSARPGSASIGSMWLEAGRDGVLVLYGDMNGDGTGDFAVSLPRVTTLTEAAFLL
jgi:hypothetical protein